MGDLTLKAPLKAPHGYFDLNLDVVWDTVQFELPKLLKELPGIRAQALEP